MPVSGKIGRVLGPTTPQSSAIASSLNAPPAWDPSLYREPDYYVYLHSISDRTFTIQQPPLVSRLNVPAREPGQRYVCFAKIPHPFNQYDRESGNGEPLVRAHDARLVAASLVNPNNPSLDQDARTPDSAVLGLGVDLASQGIFWSLNETPTEEELSKAERRRELYYRSLMEKARTLEIANPRELENTLNQDYHMAAEYFGEERSWHRKYQQKSECPNCGETIKPGVAYHKNSLGIVCIVDPARAKAAGVDAAK